MIRDTRRTLPDEPCMKCRARVIGAPVFCCRNEAHSQREKKMAPLFKADSATLSFYAAKDGKISVSYQGWDASKTVLEWQQFVLGTAGPESSMPIRACLLTLKM